MHTRVTLFYWLKQSILFQCSPSIRSSQTVEVDRWHILLSMTASYDGCLMQPWETSKWHSLFMGVSSLATSGHLPLPPLHQTNTKLEMPEPDNTNYILQLLHSLPGAWEAAPCCLHQGGTQTCVWVAALFLSKSLSIAVLSALYTIIVFPLPVSSG